MFSRDQYELLDFGAGRKLERLGEFVLDRPSPAAEGLRVGNSSLWSTANARYDRSTAKWSGDLPDQWLIEHASCRFLLRATEFGHIGLFPEQATNWDWIARHVAAAHRPIKVLNLFAYTGGSTLAAAAAGAEVTHIDAAHNVVQWARRNAELSGLESRPIRWIAEDAVKFVQRELRRGNRYDAVILDPPSYGHGPKGEAWKIDSDLPPLLDRLAELTRDDRRFVLLTCHSPGFEAAPLQEMLLRHFGAGQVEAGDLSIVTANGRRLASGHYARWMSKG